MQQENRQARKFPGANEDPPAQLQRGSQKQPHIVGPRRLLCARDVYPYQYPYRRIFRSKTMEWALPASQVSSQELHAASDPLPKCIQCSSRCAGLALNRWWCLVLSTRCVPCLGIHVLRLPSPKSGPLRPAVKVMAPTGCDPCYPLASLASRHQWLARDWTATVVSNAAQLIPADDESVPGEALLPLCRWLAPLDCDATNCHATSPSDCRDLLILPRISVRAVSVSQRRSGSPCE